MGDGTPACLTAVKIGTEGSWGDGGADVLIPVTGVSLTSPHEQILDQGLRGIAARDFGAYKGPSRAEATLEGFAFEEALEPLVHGILGAVTDRVYRLGSSAPSLAIAVSDSSNAYYEGSGLKVAELSIRFSAAEGAVTFSSSLIGKEIAALGSAFAGPGTVEDPFMGWMAASASLAGIDAELIEGEWTFSREVGLLYAAAGGATPSEVPTNAYVGPLEVTARATFDFEEAALVESYLDKDQGAYSVTFNNAAAAETLVIAAALMDLGDGPFEIDRTGVFTTIAYSMRALYVIPEPAGNKFVRITFT